MLNISSRKIIYSMSAAHPPVAFAQTGDIVCFETLDCFGGQIQSEQQRMGSINWNAINPATGPLFVQDAKPGDVLKIEILSISLDDHAVICDAPNEGVIGAVLQEESTRILPVKDKTVFWSETDTFPIAPMIGVIGTAPAQEEIPTGTPGPHGGNMDCTQIGAGAVLYLPVAVEGALLAMGDLHAVMGDGEVVVCGAEIAGAVTVRVSVLKNCAYPTPFLVNENRFMCIHSAQTLDLAATGATLAMRRFLLDELKMETHEAGMLLSLQGDVRVCQMVDPLKTCRMELPIAFVKRRSYSFL